jgi:hypothetical protein
MGMTNIGRLEALTLTISIQVMATRTDMRMIITFRYLDILRILYSPYVKFTRRDGSSNKR